jgi:hypothetical protein
VSILQVWTSITLKGGHGIQVEIIAVDAGMQLVYERKVIKI